MGSQLDCLLRKIRRIFEISDSAAGLKVEQLGGVVDVTWSYSYMLQLVTCYSYVLYRFV